MSRESRKYEREKKSFEKHVGKIHPLEKWDLSATMLLWLKPRLIKIKEGWEEYLDLEDSLQKQEHLDLKELISVIEYIIDEKYREEANPPDDLCIKFIETTKGYLMAQSTTEQIDYYTRCDELEGKARDRFIELFTNLFWRLGI